MNTKTPETVDASPEVDSVETVETRAEESAAPERRNWIGSAIRWAAAAGFVVVLATAGYEGWLLYQQHQKDVAARDALNVAERYAVTLTSADPNTIDEKVTGIINGATGDFKDKYANASSQLRKLFLDNKVTTQGSVVESAVKSATANNVEVMLFVKQTVTNSTNPEPAVDLTAVTITMEKVDGQWLASKVDLPGEPG
ncbi:Mce protein [Mycobacterium hubeiense]|uniref:Mce protein n=1 Tax=Mycobacterium hubeiense TaxID=1867256 RepID=UPI000C7F7585|nr:Mce protein [Mycobacterium sp. QGD 101]